MGIIITELHENEYSILILEKAKIIPFNIYRYVSLEGYPKKKGDTRICNENYILDVISERTNDTKFYGSIDIKKINNLNVKKNLFLAKKKIGECINFSHKKGHVYFLDNSIKEFKEIIDGLEKRRAKESVILANEFITDNSIGNISGLHLKINHGDNNSKQFYSGIISSDDENSFQTKLCYDISLKEGCYLPQYEEKAIIAVVDLFLEKNGFITQVNIKEDSYQVCLNNGCEILV